ncbi:MAG: rhodanese-like domain-containing protein [Acidobacteriaceae bacterium]|nr:rhodanese-like domain-containing protein [Acidobacteriaceae bacterium]
MSRISAPMLAEELASADPPLLLDVRNSREWAARHIDGSVNVPLNQLQERIAEMPRDGRIIHCAGWLSVFDRRQHPASIWITDLIEMAGGLAAWDAAFLNIIPAHEFCITNTQSPKEIKNEFTHP